MVIEVINRQRTLRIDRHAVAALAEKTLASEHAEGDLNIVFVGRRAITDLNRRYLGHDGPTDVISFPAGDGEDSARDASLGEVVVCADVAVDQAVARSLDVTDELYLYVVHGILHLAGWDDSTPAARTRMNRRARAIVREFRKA